MFMIQGEKWGGVFAINKFYDIANISIKETKHVTFFIDQTLSFGNPHIYLVFFREAHNWFY